MDLLRGNDMGVYSGPEIENDQLVLCVDAANPKSWSYNVHPKPLDIYGWVSSSSNCVTSRDYTFVSTTESPAGGVPLKMVVTNLDAHITSTNTYIAPAAVGQTWTVSVYAKANTAVSGQLFILGLNSANTYIEAPNLGISLTTNWQRFSFTHTFVNSLVAGIAVRLDGPDAGTASTIWWDGLQVERNSSATDFNPTPNASGNKVIDVSESDAVCSFVGSMSHSNTGEKTFNTNATTTTQFNNISIPTISFADASAYSLDFWVKLRSGAQSTYHSLTGANATAPWVILYTNDTTGASWYVRFRNASSTYQDFSNVTDWNVQTNYANITLTVSNGRVCSFYLNGLFRQSITLATSALDAVTLCGGYNSGGTYYSLQGSMGLAKFYRQTLTAGEVRKHFTANRSRFGI